MKTKLWLCGVIAFAAITVFLITGCNINVTTGSSGPKTPVAGDFTVSNLNQTADNITAVTVEPKSGKSGGTVTVYYDGSEILPTAEGEYAVTFDVAVATGWNAAVGLHGGTLTISPPGQTLADILEEIAAFLSEADGGESAEDSVYLLVNIALDGAAGGASGWQQLLDAIEDADKFIELDLSLCEMNGTVFDPVSSLSTGKDKIISIALPVAAKSITSGGYDDPTFKNFDSLTTVSGAYVTSIDRYAFHGCSNLTVANFPLAESIYENTFRDCSSLAEAYFPLIKSIYSSTFQDCSSLTEVSFPLVERIYNGAFYNCSNLTEVNFPLAESIGTQAFVMCSSLTEAYFPLAKSIDESTFWGCSSLTEVSIPLAESIGSNAFIYCNSITSITIAADCDIDSNAQIRGNFSDYYESQSKAAGTYTYNGSNWEGPF